MLNRKLMTSILTVIAASLTGCGDEDSNAADRIAAARQASPGTSERTAGSTATAMDRTGNGILAADNTGKNVGDADQGVKTPMSQSQSSANIKITADIRRAIMNDDQMSMNAQNAKIITDATGLVTLRGVVNSQAEKDSIDAKAKAIAGATRVDNQLEVKID